MLSSYRNRLSLLSFFPFVNNALYFVIKIIFDLMIWLIPYGSWTITVISLLGTYVIIGHIVDEFIK